MPNPADEIYERCVAAFSGECEFPSEALSITPNAKVKGLISATTRQIDVLIEDMRFSPTASRIIVDAKRRRRKIDIKLVEEFEGMMRDCGAKHGLIVCTNGATEGALRRAQDFITITVLPFDDALEFEWRYEPCIGRCSRSSKQIGMVLWSELRVLGFRPSELSAIGSEHIASAPILGWLMYRTGKCNRCHQFHVWCSDCGSYLALADGRIRSCECSDREWGSIPESELSGHNGTPYSTWLTLKCHDEFHALDRKPIGKVKRQLDQV